MNNKMTFLTLIVSNFFFGQWTYKTVKNDFDDPYKIAYSEINNGAILKLEAVETEKEISPKLIQDTFLYTYKTIEMIRYYDSVSNYSVAHKNIFSDELIIIYDYELTNQNNIEDIFFKIYYDGKNGVVKGSDLKLNNLQAIKTKIDNSRKANIDLLQRAMKFYESGPETKTEFKWVKEIAFYLSGGYHCDDVIDVDLVFFVGSEAKKYKLEAYKSNDNKTVFLVDDLNTHEIKSDFFKASLVKIRLNESHCDDDIYQFKMTNSSAAFQFISK